MLPGFAVSEALAIQDVPLDEMRGMKAVYACPLESVTCNARPPTEDDNFNQCSAGYGGPLCNNCAEGYSRPGLVGACVPCEVGLGGAPMQLWFVIGGATVSIVGFYVLMYIAAGFEVDEDNVSQAALELKRWVAIAKTQIGLYQVLTQLEFTLAMEFPPTFSKIVEAMKILSLDFADWLDFGCLTSYTFYSKFSFAIALPALLIFGCTVTYYISLRGKDEEGQIRCRNRLVQMCYFVAFLVYPFVSQTVFQAFNCKTLADDEAWLAADFQVDCMPVTYFLFQFLAFLCVAAIPIGLPLGTLFVLFKRRVEMQTNNSLSRQRFAFLVGDYKNEFYYWECLELIRKVLMTGILIFCKQGSMLQIVIGMAIMLTFVVGIALARPYQDRVSNMVKLASDLSLFCTMVCALMLKGDLSAEAIDANDIDNAMLFITIGLPSIATSVGEGLEMYSMTQTALHAVHAKKAMHKAQRARASGNAEEAEKEQMKAMRDLFGSVDVDGSGALDRREILKLLKAMGEAMTPKEVTVAMRIMDPHKTGNVDFHGFHAWWVGRSDTEKSQALAARAWAEVDQDGDGTLDPDEFKEVLERLGQANGMTQEDFVALMAELDHDGDGVLDREEFLNWFGSLVEDGKATLDELSDAYDEAHRQRNGDDSTPQGDDEGLSDNPLFGSTDAEQEADEEDVNQTATATTTTTTTKKKSTVSGKKPDATSHVETDNPMFADEKDAGGEVDVVATDPTGEVELPKSKKKKKKKKSGFVLKPDQVEPKADTLEIGNPVFDVDDSQSPRVDAEPSPDEVET
jgi:Ca2+-binding EF-hand superfamily protein